MKTGLLILTLFGLLACGSLRNEVSPSLLSTGGEKLVINSYISPQDTILTVKVSRSKPVLGEQTDALPYNVDNATVSLSDGKRVVVLSYLADKQWYQAKAALLPILTGKTYTLTASTPDGRQVTASATVPKPVAISQGILDSTVVTTGTRLQKVYSVRFEWQDPPGEANFYGYAAYFRWNPAAVSGQRDPNSDPIDPKTVTLRALTFARENRTGNLITDDRQDGSLLTSLTAEVGLVEVSAGSANANAALQVLTLGKVLPQSQVILQLLSTEALYYRYTDAIIRQRENRSNPFAEPVLIPTNVQGGLGCFAAYNRTEKVLRLQ